MAVERIGSPIFISVSGASGSQAVTVPAGANFIIVSATGYEDPSGTWFSAGSVSLGASALTEIETYIGLGVEVLATYRLASPPSGSQTLSWNFGIAPFYGSVLCVTFYSGVDTTSPIVSFGGVVNVGPSASAGTLTASTGDLIVGLAITVLNSGTVNTATGVTVISSLLNNSFRGTYVEGTPTGNTAVSCSSTAATYVGISAVVLRASAPVGLQPPTNLRVVQVSPTETRLEWDAPA